MCISTAVVCALVIIGLVDHRLQLQRRLLFLPQLLYCSPGSGHCSLAGQFVVTARSFMFIGLDEASVWPVSCVAVTVALTTRTLQQLMMAATKTLMKRKRKITMLLNLMFMTSLTMPNVADCAHLEFSGQCDLTGDDEYNNKITTGQPLSRAPLQGAATWEI